MTSASLTAWFTPTFLFCILNLTIGIVFLTSRRKRSGGDPPAPLVRAPSLLQRVKSFNFTLHREDQSYAAAQLEEEKYYADENHQIMRSKSEASVEGPSSPVKALKKSVSEKDVISAAEGKLPATLKERKGKGVSSGRIGEDEAVDKKADDFINRFRQQLKLQRLDSLLKYKEMLERGVGR